MEKMKVLCPKHMGYNSKQNEGFCGFAWHIFPGNRIVEVYQVSFRFLVGLSVPYSGILSFHMFLPSAILYRFFHSAYPWRLDDEQLPKSSSTLPKKNGTDLFGFFLRKTPPVPKNQDIVGCTLTNVPPSWKIPYISPIWMFPKIVVPPNHPLKNGVFHYKPSILGYHHFRKPPYSRYLWVIPKNPIREHQLTTILEAWQGGNSL